MVLRRPWIAAGAAGAVGIAFLGLVAVGTYAAAPASAGGALSLAPGTVPAAYQGLIQKWGTLCPELSPPLLAAQLYQESGFDPTAVSPAKAYGIAQFIAPTWESHGVDGNGDGRRDIWNPADAIPSAASYDCSLARDTRQVPGDRVANMLAAYNAGPYAVIQAGGVPPYAETQGYVKRIRSLAAGFTA
ncbi:lytic transglycosylase domain-containing protein, partial [Streptacidiphilus griseoplanus]|uniref:lytic transglycosylase domain-containing protein n=1 Tax=Peterkaempfera griseoplana TaxID=66896 RepID=UPI001FE1D780